MSMTMEEINAALEAVVRSTRLTIQQEARDGQRTDAELLSCQALFPEWEAGISVFIGDCYRYQDILYRCLQAHTTQSDWTPVAAVSLWAKVLIPDPSVIPEWEQPESTNPYMSGDKVLHNGKTWVSNIDNNVWEPGVYGWTEVAK